MARPRGLMRALLGWAAGGRFSLEAGRFEGEDADRGDRQLRHVVDAGLAPLAYHAARDQLQTLPSCWVEILKAADVTARFTHAARRETAVQVIDTCRGLGIDVTLLKGISIEDQCYPVPHLRPMGDVDLLLPARDAARIESALLDLGYARKPDWIDGEGEPHGAPLRDPHRDVWIEPHTALFHRDAPVNAGRLFGPETVASMSIASTFNERPVQRLRDELQLAYIACYWLRDITNNGTHPTFVIPLVDALLLLRSSARTLDWDALLGSIDNDLAAASLYLLLAEASAHGCEEVLAPVLPRLAARQRILGAAELRVLHRMLDASLVDGKPFMGAFGRRHPMIETTLLDTLLTPEAFIRKVAKLPWNFVFPPRAPERYSLRYQAARMARFVRGG
ncbi:MAG: nucleotidyltransferase family protein [Burkholderiales bacterium]